MKKVNLLLIASALFTLGLTNQNIIEETKDYQANEPLNVYRNMQIGKDSKIEYSDTYVQHGKINGVDCLRFITAIKGNVNQISYTRNAIGDLATSIKEVNTLYKAVLANGEVTYYDGTNVTTDTSYEGNYYWACYTIKFNTTKYRTTDISVSFNVDGEQKSSRTANLEAIINEESIANEVKDHTLFVHKEGTTRFEAEEVDVSNYVISSDNATNIVERSDASNGRFLAASTGDTAKNSTFTFKINLDFNASVSMKASYAQTEKKKYKEMDMRETYTYKVDDKDTLSLSNKTTLVARDDITIWEEFAYNSIVLSKGEHTFNVTIKSNIGGNPNIDYMDFTFIKVTDNVIDNHTLFVHKEGTTRFEAEEVDVSNYVISSDNATNIVERSDASNGRFLAASTGDMAKNSTFTFKINLDFDAELSMTASYAQSEKKKANAMDMREAYTYKVDDKDTLSLSSKTILEARNDVTIWEEFEYSPITLNKGEHTFSVTIKSNTGKGNPNIDYMDFTLVRL